MPSIKEHNRQGLAQLGVAEFFLACGMSLLLQRQRLIEYEAARTTESNETCIFCD